MSHSISISIVIEHVYYDLKLTVELWKSFSFVDFQTKLAIESDTRHLPKILYVCKVPLIYSLEMAKLRWSNAVEP